MFPRTAIAVVTVVLLCIVPAIGQDHDHSGAAEKLGTVAFATSCNAGAQAQFNRAVALLHSFDYYDAERAFRWCLKIEPGNAMAYWGLALATEARDASGKTRAADFLREAVKRKASLTERERLYIEAWEVSLLPDLVKPVSGKAATGTMRISDLSTSGGGTTPGVGTALRFSATRISWLGAADSPVTESSAVTSSPSSAAFERGTTNSALATSSAFSSHSPGVTSIPLVK